MSTTFAADGTDAISAPSAGLLHNELLLQNTSPGARFHATGRRAADLLCYVKDFVAAKPRLQIF